MSHVADSVSISIGSIGPSIHGSGVSFGPHSGALLVGAVLVALIALLVWSMVDG
jgi:hypothetical protein